MNKICPNCSSYSLHWNSDAEAEECGYSVAGIVTFYHCANCGAEVEVFVPNEREGE